MAAPPEKHDVLAETLADVGIALHDGEEMRRGLRSPPCRPTLGRTQLIQYAAIYYNTAQHNTL
eukprot:9313500-Lingulodinium_polyedra.AAC.1